jgi:stage III sporulation protein AA
MEMKMNSIIKLLGTNIRNIVSKQSELIEREAVEIRLRVNSPVFIKFIHKGIFMDNDLKLSKKDIDETISIVTKNSIHAYEKEIRNGYITVEGGHRIGLGGDCIYEGDLFKGFKNITSLNIRIAREFPGCSKNFLKFFVSTKQNIYNTLIIGPPMSGKTTFIRDVAANLSDGFSNPYFEGCDTAIIDERGEISSVFGGVPQMYVGKRSDVLSYCMKREGFFMSIRSLSPKAIISDELGSMDDFETVQYALKSGVNIITTAHGFSLDDVKKNIYMKSILENNFFDRAVILKSSDKPTAVKEIYDLQRNKVIFSDVG